MIRQLYVGCKNGLRKGSVTNPWILKFAVSYYIFQQTNVFYLLEQEWPNVLTEGRIRDCLASERPNTVRFT